ncbi:MAG: glutathione synthase [Pseudomonadota bacterium]|nr:glutathione synthase [Pseudomonadota bacterium]
MKKILAIQGSDLKKVNIKTDTTILLASEAQKKGYKVYYYEPENLSFLNGKVIAACKHISINENKKKFYSLLKNVDFNLEKSKVILIRNDPPFDNRYLYTTFLLSHISKKVKIINHPSAVRNISEKLFSINFMKYMPPTLISENLTEIRSFFNKHKAIVAKPINGFSGNNVTLLKTFNTIKIRKLLKTHNHLFFQKFLPGVSKGDKRVFIIKGKIAGVISRVPKKGSILSNMSKGAKAKLTKLTSKEIKASKVIGKLLLKNNIYFAGVDFVQEKLIGDINVTSPTGLAAYKGLSGINLAKLFWNNI